MADTTLNEREFELINIVGGELGVNQRDLSRQLNLSLGLTNMLLRRMVTKGYIRIRQLDQRKVQYLLTPKGFSEKMRKSVKYTLKTINSIGLIKKRLQEILSDLYGKGHRKFYIVGEEDIASLVQLVLKESFGNDYEALRVEEITPGTKDGVFLLCLEEIDAAKSKDVEVVRLIELISSK